MKELIEYKLWGGNIPYFVSETFPCPERDGKRCGMSKDTKHCYLPDTIRVLTYDEFIEIVINSDLIREVESDELDDENNPIIKHVFMTAEEKKEYADNWINKRT